MSERGKGRKREGVLLHLKPLFIYPKESRGERRRVSVQQQQLFLIKYN